MESFLWLSFTCFTLVCKLITNTANIPFTHVAVTARGNNTVFHAKHQLHCFLDQSVQPFLEMGSFFNLKLIKMGSFFNLRIDESRRCQMRLPLERGVGDILLPQKI